MLCTDGSNYAQYDFTPDQLGAWQAAGVGLHLEQALAPPAGYPRGRTQQHVQACLDFGLPVGFYVFWWAGAGTDYLKRQLALLELFTGRLVRGWNDLEDTTVRGMTSQAGTTQRGPLPQEHLWRIARQPPPDRDWDHVRRLTASITGLQDDIARWFEVLDQFPVIIEDAGKYSGPWYDGAYIDLSPFKGRPWWTAEYDGIANVNRVTPWGGNTAPATLKQYVGSTSLAGYGGIDLSVVSDEEAALMAQATDGSRQKLIEDLKGALGYVTVDVQAAIRQATKARTRAAEKQAVLNSAAELQRVHDQFLSEG